MVSRNFVRLALLAAGYVSAAEIGPRDGLIVHEWGTFTAVADADGRAQEWLPLAAPSDLPCFVHRLDGRSFKGIMPATIRMETPVLYFYSPRTVTAAVKVDFPQGLITEWYPQAKHSAPSAIEWDPIALSAAPQPLPHEGGPSHYYAARETDALTVTSGGERDRMIFYRGLANFPIPPHPRGIIFENRGGTSGNAAEVRKRLEAALIESGLYPKEAHAMIETWGDSWFEEGRREFYIVPRETVDRLLPISISPEPEKLVRTFVGRTELLAPWMRAEIEMALAAGDLAALARRGRFLDGFLAQMKDSPRDPRVDEWLQQRRAEGQRRFFTGECDVKP